MFLEKIIEGIDVEEELNKVIKVKSDMIQGYYFSKPSPVAQFEKQFLHTTILFDAFKRFMAKVYNKG